MKNILLGNAPINNGNRGCVALSYCAMYIVDRLFGKGNYMLYLSDSLQQEGFHQIELPSTTITYQSISIPRIQSFRDLLSCLFRIKKTCRSILQMKEIDYVLDIGQGDSFADIYGKGRFDMIDSIHRIARLLHKQYILLPQTIGPFKDKTIIKQANATINKATLVMARDKSSYEYAIKVGRNVKEYIDIAFLLPYKKIEFDKNYIHVGLNISALLWNGGYTKNNQFGLNCNYQNTIRDIIDYFLSNPKVILHLVPHVVEQEKGVENDYEVSFNIWSEYQNHHLVIAPFFLTPIDAKSYISGMDFFIGARMHSTIAAFSSGVPVIPMAYSRKFNGLFAETLQYENIVDMKTMNNDEILQEIKKSFETRNQLSNRINDVVKGIVQDRCSQMFDDLGTIFSS